MRLIHCLCLIVAGALLACSAGCSPRKRTLVIATGQDGGTYQGAAESLFGVIDKDLPEVTFDRRPSHGSIESML